MLSGTIHKETLVKPLFLSALALAAILAVPAHAVTATDPTGDLLTSFGGDRLNSPFLDILSFSVEQQGADFLVSATMAGEIGGKGGAYVLGVDRGGGGARPRAFASIGQPNIIFDQAFVVRDNGDVLLSGVKKFTFSIVDDSLHHTGTFSGRLTGLQSTGFAPRDFQFSLWSQQPTIAGLARNADFAPENATIAGVPEPASWALMLMGFAATGALVRNARRRTRLATA